MMDVSRIKSSRYRLLVEGPDDQHAVINLMKRHGVNYDLPQIGMPYVDPCGGWTEVLDTVPVALKNYDQLGIMLDADLNRHSRWFQVRDLLRQQGVAVPDDLLAEGLIIAGSRPHSSVGIWLMPNNQSEGMLEHFLDRLIPQDDLWEHACDAVRDARAKAAPFAHEIKARVHTWLAWQEPPGQPFGVAITSRCFRMEVPEAIRFAAWFKRIFPRSAVSPAV